MFFSIFLSQLFLVASCLENQLTLTAFMNQTKENLQELSTSDASLQPLLSFIKSIKTTWRGEELKFWTHQNSMEYKEIRLLKNYNEIHSEIIAQFLSSKKINGEKNKVVVADSTGVWYEILFAHLGYSVISIEDTPYHHYSLQKTLSQNPEYNISLIPLHLSADKNICNVYCTKFLRCGCAPIMSSLCKSDYLGPVVSGRLSSISSYLKEAGVLFLETNEDSICMLKQGINLLESIRIPLIYIIYQLHSGKKEDIFSPLIAAGYQVSEEDPSGPFIPLEKIKMSTKYYFFLVPS